MSGTYSTARGKNLYHGIVYQLKWLMLFLKRAVDKEYSFRLATEMNSAAYFDDLVFQYERDKSDGTKETVWRFIQIKHTRKRYKKISINDLFTEEKNSDFSLVKYLVAYFIIKNGGNFDNGILEDFVIAINSKLDLESFVDKKISVTRIKEKDDFFSIGNGERYKLIDSGDKIAEYLKQNIGPIKDKLNKKIKRFDNEKERKEISNEKINEGIKDFLNKLVLAVNLPNEIELGELIKNELGQEFNSIDRKNVYSRFLEEALNWMTAEEGKFLSHEEIRDFFEKLREEILGAIWFNVKDPVRLFTGREMELEMLHNAIQRDPKGTVISHITSIVGLGGMGKSELARKYAYKHSKDYDGNVIWIDAEKHETMKESFLELANRLGIPPKNKYGKRKTIGEIVKEIYAFFAKRKSLFIFDNAEKNGNLNKFLPYSLSSDLNKPYILITSHDQEWEKGMDVIVLKELELEDAVRFVKKGLDIPERDTSQDQEIKNLLRKLQCFPLALQQAISYIEDQRIEEEFEISDYLKEYGKKTKKLLKSKVFQGIDNNYTKTTFTTLEITMDKVRSNKQYGQLASEILDTLTYFAPDKIAREIFLNSISGYKKGQLKLAIRLLVRYSMVSGKQKQSILNIHRLVQDVTRLKLREEKREEEVLRKALELINGSNVTQGNTIHVASVWGYASQYDKLIDEFFFNSIYGEYKSTPLHLLAENGNYEAIEAILTHIEEKHIDRLNKVVNVKTKDGDTPLHLAAYNGKLDVIEYLISKGANVNAKSKDNWVPLHWASHSGVLGVVKHLVSNGADVNAKSKQDGTPLHLAARMGKLNVVEYLLGKGANVDANTTRPLYNGTPLHLAAYHGELDIAKYLIGKGANVNARDRHDCTPLHRAAYNGKLDVVEYLISKGTDINAEDKDGNIPLYKATENGKLSVVEYFINKGADVNAKNKYGWTLLHGAAFQGKFDIVEYLIKKGADINVRNKYDSVPLHLAAYSGELNVVKCLISKGADVNANNKHDGTPLHLAVCSGVLDIVKYLVSKNVDVNVSNKYSGTPLHIAVYGGRLDIVKYLIDKGANVNIGNRYDWAPLHIAAFSEMLEVIEYLIGKGADINAKNKNGDTPLYLAAMKGKADIAKILLKYNADINIKNNKGMTALHYATNANHQELVELLLFYGANPILEST